MTQVPNELVFSMNQKFFAAPKLFECTGLNQYLPLILSSRHYSGNLKEPKLVIKLGFPLFLGMQIAYISLLRNFGSEKEPIKRSMTMAATSTSSLQVYTAEQTAALLPFPALIDALTQTLRHYEAGAIHSPERMVVPFNTAVLLSMPAIADDIVAHKLITVQPSNSARALPAIHGLVTAFDSTTGIPLFVLDGPEVTGRRTAAVSMLGLRTLGPSQVRNVLLYGTGTQARYHLQALAECHPNSTVHIKARTLPEAQEFCAKHTALPLQLIPIDETLPEAIDVVITVTTSLKAVYDLPALAGRLIIGVGAFRPEMAEIGATTLAGSAIYVDDIVGAPHEAGDLMQAGVDWGQVHSLASAFDQQSAPSQPIVFKSVGTAAWDLAACRLARQVLQNHSNA